VARAFPGESTVQRDRTLLGELAAAKPEALAELYDRHAAPLFRHALTLCGRRAEAEDLVQATFLKLATTTADLRRVTAPAGYLHRMLHSTWIDVHRRTVVGDRVAEQIGVQTSEPVAAIEESIDLTRALERLAAPQREVIGLHLVEGFSFREIGRVTGVSLFTAAARYRLGIARLRKELSRPPGERS